jgi:D-serine deaminase-like pyridoxal phosphate-dependent protein
MSQPVPAAAGDPIDAIDTPALILELDAFEANLARMAALVRGTGVALRPHAKSHKCPEIARRQLAAGAVGVCCQKVSEAAAMVDGGVGDVLVSNQVVGRRKIERLVALAARARVSVCVDDAANAAALDEAARAAGVQLDVLVEVDVGTPRCGVAPGAATVALARVVAESASLRFTGLHGYHGMAQHLRAVAERRAAIASAGEQLRATVGALDAAGLRARVVTGGGTGTFPFELASGVYNEIQPGSYIFMDADYDRNDWAGQPRFAQSLFVLTTVMSTAGPGRAVVDAGLKASSVDSGLPLVDGGGGLAYVNASDEHGVLLVPPGARAPALGDRLRLIPGHCDPTVNLHDWLVAVRADRVAAVWPISARGCGA